MEGDDARVRGMSAVSPGEVATPRVRELWLLRRPSGHRGRLARVRLDDALGFSINDAELAALALTHRSYAFERGLEATNERLEFLGDAVLGVVVTDIAFREHPELAEGELAKLRAATVSMTALAEVAAELDLGALVLLGKGEELSGGREKSSILADCLEAVIGAAYLDRGLDVTTELIRRLFVPRMDRWVRGEGNRDYKTNLQELASQDFGKLPEYRIQEQGPDHMKEFTATVVLDGREWGSGSGRSKKEAEQHAAAEALVKIGAERAGEG